MNEQSQSLPSPPPQCTSDRVSLQPRPHRLTSIGQRRGGSGHRGRSPASRCPGAGPPRRAGSRRLRGGRRFPGAARPGLARCPPHFLSHSLISARGCQGDEDGRGDPLLRLCGHCLAPGAGLGAEWNVGSGHRYPPPGHRPLPGGPPPNKLAASPPHQTASPAKEGLGCPCGRAGAHQVTWLQGGTQQSRLPLPRT